MERAHYQDMLKFFVDRWPTIYGGESPGKWVILFTIPTAELYTTYYRWRKEYGGLQVNQAQRLKELERETGRMKKSVAEHALDISVLKEVTSGN